MTFKFKFASISDVHLGHPHTSTLEIIEKLEVAFADNAETASLDAIFIGGDLFDRLLWWNDINVSLVEMWMYNLLVLCKKHDILLRILEGTPSHDRKQSKKFLTVAEIAAVGADVKYMERLEIEYIERYGIHVLYVPDEWKPNTDDTWMDVTNALAMAGIDKVDYAIMHGVFNYQLPAVAQVPKHNEERYLGIVKRIITIGHHHEKSRFDRIIAQGSFDRLVHGNESAKGYYVIDSVGDVDNVTFMENKAAKIYLTIDCRGLSLEEALEKIGSYAHYPIDSYMRVHASAGDPILSALSMLKQKYVGFNWTTKTDDGKKTAKQVMEMTKSKYIPISITEDNIVSMIQKRLEAKGIESDMIAQCVRLLEAGRRL